MAISKVSYNKTPQAHDDAYQMVTYAGAITLNLMANDQGGNAKTMYSIDNGISATLNGGPADLLTQDVVNKSSGKSPFEYSSLGAKIWINANGTIGYDASGVTMPPAGTSVVDSFIYAIRMADGTLSWARATVVLGNHAAVVSGPVTGTALEDGPAVSLDALKYATDDFTTSLGVHYESSTLPAGVTYDAATHSFVLDPSDGAYQHLNAGAHATVTVNYTVWDGYVETAATASWDVTGVNDTASISGGSAGGVTEDDSTMQTAGGTLAVADVDDGENTFQGVAAGALDGDYGTFTFDASSGAWGYTLDNDSEAVQTLGEGETAEDTLTVKSSDGTATRVIVVTITGTNDVPVVSAPVTGTATEDGATSSLDALGNATDKDANDTLSVTGLPDTLPDGVTYDSSTHQFTLDPSAEGYQHLAAGVHATVTVDYQVTDGHVAVDQTASWDVVGVNDDATITGPNTGDVKEDDSTSQTAGGTLAVSDVDDGEDTFDDPAPGALNGHYGSFTFDTSTGEWGYTLDNDAVQFLGEGETREDTLTVASKDGTDQSTITVTITGVNDAPVVSAPVTGTATEDDVPSSLDALAHASDADDSDTLSVTSVPSTLPAGVTWDEDTHTFVLDPSDDAIQHLAAGAHTTVTVDYQVTDGHVSVDQSASWIVTGVNDIASMGGSYLGSVTEDSVFVADGQLTVSDVDDDQSTFKAPTASSLHGTYGDFSFNTSTGTWSYTLANAAGVVQSLGSGDHMLDQLTVWSLDESASETIQVTVNGADEPIVVNLITTYQVQHGKNQSDHQTITGFDDNDVLKMDGQVHYFGIGSSGGDTVVTFVDKDGEHFDITLVGYTGFDLGTQLI